MYEVTWPSRPRYRAGSHRTSSRNYCTLSSPSKLCHGCNKAYPQPVTPTDISHNSDSYRHETMMSADGPGATEHVSPATSRQDFSSFPHFDVYRRQTRTANFCCGSWHETTYRVSNIHQRRNHKGGTATTWVLRGMDASLHLLWLRRPKFKATLRR